MQQLSQRRLTDTPTNIPHVRGNCGLSLNSPEGRGSVAGLSTCGNNSDADLTPEGENMQVYVLNHKGKPLMPCSPRKARLLLKQHRAKVAKRTPFTIQWIAPTRSYTQPITLGVNSGYTYVGLSAVSEKKELLAVDVTLRADMVKLNSERRTYRRARRARKTWHRKPRFLNRRKPEGWLAPSIQHKLDSHIKLINRVKEILPISKIMVDAAAFDIQKIKNPEISGVDYQNGEQKGFWNVREYVLYRDGHACQHCKGRSRDRVLEVHHIKSRQTGSNRPDNLITLCSTCHDRVSKGEIILKVKPSKGFKAETFMTMTRWKLINQLKEMGYVVSHTYGYLTKNIRIALNLAKSHINDAFVIAGGNNHLRSQNLYVVKQVRKCNRKLFKGNRSHIKNTAPREVFGFRRWDKVLLDGKELFIKGRRLSGFFALSDIEGKLVRETSYKNLVLLERARTLLIERRRAAISPGPLKGMDFLAA